MASYPQHVSGYEVKDGHPVGMASALLTAGEGLLSSL